MATEEQVKELAYNLWDKEGRPEGRDVEHYFTAKRMLDEQEAPQAHAIGTKSTVATSRAQTGAPKATSSTSPGQHRSLLHGKQH